MVERMMRAVRRTIRKSRIWFLFCHLSAGSVRHGGSVVKSVEKCWKSGGGIFLKRIFHCYITVLYRLDFRLHVVVVMFPTTARAYRGCGIDQLYYFLIFF